METGKGKGSPAGPGWTWRSVLLLSAAYEVLVLASAVIPGFPGGAATPVPPGAGMAALALACALATAALFLARRVPRVASIACCALYAGATALGYGGFLGTPALASLYALGRWAPPAKVAGGALASLAIAAAGAALGTPGTELPEALVSLLAFAVPLALGMVLAAREEARCARERELVEQTRARMLEAQRDGAVSRARVAAELHDSVGHGLTVIIALSEGLKGIVTGDPEVSEALAGINETARECLAQTREAVASLADSDNGASLSSSALHVWDDVAPMIAHAREAGIACVLAETGRRLSDAGQADLAFSLTREAVTNALRHGRASSVVVSWDHRADGSLALSVRDDGAPEGEPNTEDGATRPLSGAGTGLERLGRRVRGAGGTFLAGPSGGGWTVEADIPASPPVGSAPDEGGRP